MINCRSFDSFRSWSTTDLLTVVSDRIARTFNRSGTTGAVVLDISKAFGSLLFFTNLNGISGQLFGFISSFLSNRQFRVVLDGKSSQEYLVNTEVRIKGPFFILHFSSYTLMTFLMMLSVILLSMLMILLSTVNVNMRFSCGNNLNWLLNLNLIYKTLWTGSGSGLLIAILEKLTKFCLTSVKMLVLLMWKWMGLFLGKNHLLSCWRWLSLLNWIRAFTFSLPLKLSPRKLEPWFVLWSLFLLLLLCISIPYSDVWNTVVMSGQVLLVATWNCWISYQNRYEKLLALHLLPLLNPWFIVGI